VTYWLHSLSSNMIVMYNLNALRTSSQIEIILTM
jgi:hypothetical protein